MHARGKVNYPIAKLISQPKPNSGLPLQKRMPKHANTPTARAPH